MGGRLADRIDAGRGVRLARRLGRVLIALGLMGPLVALGPASCAQRSGRGFHYTVRPGDNLFRIGQRYDVSSQALQRANGIRDVTGLQVGQELWIPNGRISKADRRKAEAAASPTRTAASRNPGASRPAQSQARADARTEARKEARLSFIWPVQGRLTSRFGPRNGRPHEGVDVAARSGTRIRAAEAGKVIHSGRLGAYGKVVIVKHSGDYRSVYAHARKTLVRKGQFVEKGDRIAEVGNTGRSSGPHLHFEIRRRATPKDPMMYLP